MYPNSANALLVASRSPPTAVPKPPWLYSTPGNVPGPVGTLSQEPSGLWVTTMMGVGVEVGVAVGIGVSVALGTEVAVELGVALGAGVGVLVGVGVGVGVGV